MPHTQPALEEFIPSSMEVIYRIRRDSLSVRLFGWGYTWTVFSKQLVIFQQINTGLNAFRCFLAFA